MASLMDLIAGYSQGGAPTDDSSQSLGQAARDLYQGLINPKALQEAQQASRRTYNVMPSVLESLARGSLAQVPGTAGDVSSLLRQLSPQTMQKIFGNRVAPTTEEILGYVPRATPAYQGSQEHEMVGGLLSPAMGYFAKALPLATKDMPIGNMIAYHGTPHEIQGGFDISKVGTGEGAQAYGHGMYFAENPKVATEYQKMLVGPEATAAQYLQMYKTPESAISALEYGITPNLTAEAKKFSEDAINVLKSGKELKGNLYKVDVPDHYIPKMIDFDSPISKQPKEFVELLKDVSKNENFDPFEHLALAQTIGKHPRNAPDYKPTGEELMNNVADILGIERNGSEFSKIMKEYGIKGVRYLDEGSRNQAVQPYYQLIRKSDNSVYTQMQSLKNAKEFVKDAKKQGVEFEISAPVDKRTRNFVSFDPQTVKILEKNNKPTRKEAIKKQLDELK